MTLDFGYNGNLNTNIMYNFALIFIDQFVSYQVLIIQTFTSTVPYNKYYPVDNNTI